MCKLCYIFSMALSYLKKNLSYLKVPYHEYFVELIGLIYK